MLIFVNILIVVGNLVLPNVSKYLPTQKSLVIGIHGPKRLQPISVHVQTKVPQKVLISLFEFLDTIYAVLEEIRLKTLKTPTIH